MPSTQDHDIPVGGNGGQSAHTSSNHTLQRDNSTSSKTRNVRNLSLAPSPPPVTQATSTSSYSSFAESARILSPNPPTPRLGAHPLQTIPSSRPGTPSLLGHPRTPGHGFVPLTPTTPGGVVFSPNTPVFSPNGLPPTSPNPAPTKASKLKSQLTSFLPVSKHTYFHAKIVIEQLSSVPFVGGHFGVRWKFKSVHRHSGAHEDEDGQRLFGRSKAKPSSTKDKGKLRDDATEFGFHPSHQSSVSSTDTATSSASHASSLTSGTASTSWSSTSMSSVQTNSTAATKMGNGTTPSTNLSRNFYSPYSSAGPTTSPTSREAQYGPSQYLFVPPEGSAASTPAGTSPGDAGSSLLMSPNAQQAFSSNAAITPMSPNFNVVSPTGTATQGNPSVGGGSNAGTSAARGMTPYLPLKDHSVTFSFPLDAIVKMDVSRGGGSNAADQTKDAAAHLNPNDPHSNSSASLASAMSPTAQKPNLQPSPLKLVVMQRVEGHDSSNVQNPRLGAVFINLAEYVGKGKVERRFLLKESKVNATLKLSVEVTYVSGYQGYIAPPLQKTEILGGIEGFLKEHDHLLSKKKATTMGAGLSASAAAPGGTARTRGKVVAGISVSEKIDSEAASGSVEQEEFEVDLLRKGFLEREKDRIGEGMVAHMVLADVGAKPPLAGMDAAGQSGWDEAVSLLGSVPANAGLHPRGNVDPYALPSESETESEYGGAPMDGRPVPVRRMTEEALGRKRWKEEQRAKRREERAKKLMLDLSESEADSVFESADEGIEVEGTVQLSETIVVGQPAKAAAAPAHQTRVRMAAFDVQRLPLSYGPKTTESLIEAIFNPGPTTEEADDDPFVVYVSPAELRERQMMEMAARREMEQRAEQEAKNQRDHERALLAEQQQSHWYRSRRRETEDSIAGGHVGGLRMKIRRGAKRAGTMESTASSSTTSGSGSGGSPGVQLNSIRSPGEDTIMGVRVGEDEGEVLSPATITAGRPGPSFAGLGIGLEGTPIPNAPSERDRDATIGRGASGGTAAVGSFLHNYYRAKKDKVKEKASGVRRSKEKQQQILDGGYVDQEPSEMAYGQLGQGKGPGNGHQRSATGGTMSSNASTSSLSSLSLGSQSASGHGHGPVVVPGPKGGAGHPDLSIPPGRVVVKGVSPSLGEPVGDDASGLGSKLKGWLKGSK